VGGNNRFTYSLDFLVKPCLWHNLDVPNRGWKPGSLMATINQYKNLHKWMIIPMVFMQFGIFADYWGDFSDNAWSVHIHYWTGTIWYLYLIIQPYYATSGQLDKHRTNGIIGMLLAGGVAITALSMMHRDIESAHRAVEFADRFGPFKPWFFYGVVFVEIVMMTAFIYAVVQSIIHRKNLANHSWWLISTVFIIMMPALGRGVQNTWIAIAGRNDHSVMNPLYLTVFIIITLALLTARKYGQIRHPATYLAVGVNIVNCLVEPIGKSESIQGLFESMIKG
jgi:hypothetical protein